jgi:hypothetical protein
LQIPSACNVIYRAERQIFQTLRDSDTNIPVVGKRPVGPSQEWSLEVQFQIFVSEAKGCGNPLQFDLDLFC